MSKRSENKKAMKHGPLLCSVKPIKDNGMVEFWGKLDSLKDGKWHRVAIVINDGVRTNYIDGEIV